VVAGDDEGGRPRHPDDLVDVMSVTKLFTANVVHRVAAFGLLDLDAPMPTLSRYPDFPYTQLTPRNLLAHQSGLPNYWDTPRYIEEPLTITDPLDAVAAVAQRPLVAEPGTISEYSSTNYLLLGLILEEVTGVPFDDLLRNLLLDPLGLPSVVHLPPEPGLPRGATAGILADLADLTVAGAELVRDPLGLDDMARTDFMAIDRETGIGPGVNGFCPCTETEDARVDWFGVGYTGGHTILLHLPGPDLVVALDLTGTLWSDHRFEQVMRLMEDLVAFDWGAPPMSNDGDTVTA
jgi:CubicO group peptidase (beta-lactamase class C family)